MAELPDEIHERIAHLSNEGNSLAERSDFNGALERFRSAWDLLPEPRDEWDAALWLLTSIGDMHFQLRQYPEARQSLMAAMKSADGAPGNPFLRLRLGQVMYELGEKQEASSWLAGAYVMEGASLFDGDDPKYLAFVKPQLRPPPGGWPDEHRKPWWRFW